MNHSRRLATFAVSFFIVSTSLPALAESITVDTTINSLSPFSNTKILVSDGSEGPTTVRVEPGGSVAGFALEESSHLILDGGDVTLLGSLTDNSKLTILSGSLGCLEDVCPVIDYHTFINASGNSAIELKGEFSDVRFGLRGNSTLTVFGTNLSKTDPDSNYEFIVQGKLLDGSDFLTYVSSNNGASPIILVEVPEPTGAISLFGIVPALAFFMRFRIRHSNP